eukprot:361118-Chlamydomonas_euryale.AAC.6
MSGPPSRKAAGKVPGVAQSVRVSPLFHTCCRAFLFRLQWPHWDTDPSLLPFATANQRNASATNDAARMIGSRMRCGGAVGRRAPGAVRAAGRSTPAAPVTKTAPGQQQLQRRRVNPAIRLPRPPSTRGGGSLQHTRGRDGRLRVIRAAGARGDGEESAGAALGRRASRTVSKTPWPFQAGGLLPSARIRAPASCHTELRL